MDPQIEQACLAIVGPAERIETHISWVLRGEREVLKVKRPVRLPFLDFSTVEARRRFCEAEVRLNERLAPGVYLGVESLPLAGRPPEPAVRMRRLPDEGRADVRLAQGRLDERHLELLAGRLAAFHEAAEGGDAIAAAGAPDAVRRNVEENLAALAAAPDLPGSELVASIAAWQREFLARAGPLLRERVARGRIRDGHGDLRLEHVYLDDRGGVVVIDCVEFSDELRRGDVASDLAFLSMDLARSGRVDLAERLLALWARATGDFDLYPLADFYESYRACVRAKIAAVLAADEDAGREARARGEGEARRYLLLAASAARRPLVPPSVVVVSGIIGSGKSTLADALAAGLAAPVIDTDRTRKQLLGIPPTEPRHDPPHAGAYAPEVTERTYAEMLRRASAVLDAGRPVVLDGAFATPALRAGARSLAANRSLGFLLVECRAPREVLRARLEQRARTSSISDGRAAILDELADRFEPAHELPAAERLELDTTQPLAENLAALRARIERPEGGL